MYWASLQGDQRLSRGCHVTGTQMCFAISGLLDHRTTDIFSKMPGIGDVPVLGQLFRSKNVNHSTVELMVVVTPMLIDPLTDMTSPTLPKLPVPLLDPTQFDKKTGKQKAPAQPQTGGPQ